MGVGAKQGSYSSVVNGKCCWPELGCLIVTTLIAVSIARL